MNGHNTPLVHLALAFSKVAADFLPLLVGLALKVENTFGEVVGKLLERWFCAVRSIEIKEKLPSAIPSDTTDIYESTVSEIVPFQQILPIIQLRCLLVRGETIGGRVFQLSRNAQEPSKSGPSLFVAKAGVYCRKERVAIPISLQN